MKTKIIILLSFLALSFAGYGQVKVNSAGNVGIGTEPESGQYSRKLKINGGAVINHHSISSALSISGNCYGSIVSISGSTNNHHLRVNGTAYSTGGWTGSDKLFKKNINKIDGNQMLSKLMNIEGKRYEFKSPNELESLYNSGEIRTNDSLSLNIPQFSKGYQYGLIAQEIEKEFPELVMMDSITMTRAINYDGMIPVLIEALKEQQHQINELKKALGNNRFDNREKGGGAKSGALNIGGSDTSFDEYTKMPELHQNTPNPFNRDTRINYYLPYEVSSATLYVYNMQGNQIKNYRLSGRGNASHTIHAQELEPGMYLYTLIADGKEVGTKRMVLTE